MNELQIKARKCMEILKASGVDKGFCSIGSTVKTEFNIDNGKFSLLRTLFDHSLFITVYNGGKKGVISTNRIDDDSIAAAVKDCIAASESASPDNAWEIAPVTKNQAFTAGCIVPDTDKLFDRTAELLKDVGERHPKIMMQQFVISHIRVERAYANTNGVEYTTTAGAYEVDLMFSAHEGEKTSSFYGSGLECADLDKPFIELGTIEKDFCDVEKQVETVPIDGKFTGTVIFPPQSLGSVIGTAISNFASDMSILDGTSIWKDKLGKQVADARITISDRPLDKRIVTGERYTSDGYISEDYDIIKDGVLDAFRLSSYVANKTGGKRAPNTAGAFIMQNGDTPIDEIIKGVKRGIIVGRLSGGSPSSNGDFSSVAKNSFYVEDGEIKYAISETMINGNLAEMLMNLRAISVETVCDGMSVLPYAAFDNLVISGK